MSINKQFKIKSILIGIIVFLIIGVALLFLVNNLYSPAKAATEALKSDSVVTVKDDRYISFTPKDKKPTKGLILYPGMGVESESYAPLCREIATAGYEVVMAKMPLNLAVLEPNEAKKIINDYKNIDTWAIGGHSLGGVVASSFATKNDKVKGLILYSSYPIGNKLVHSNKKVLSIWGSEDAILNVDSLKKTASKLPKDTKFVEIKGGNHSQFADYGLQIGDNKALISEKEQTDIAAKNTIELLKSIN